MQDLNLVRKTTKTLKVTFSNKSTGLPIDITGYTLYFTVKKTPSQPDSLANIFKTVTTHTNPTAGETQILLTPEDTDIPQGNYIYDLCYITNSNNRYSTVPKNFIVMGKVKD